MCRVNGRQTLRIRHMPMRYAWQPAEAEQKFGLYPALPKLQHVHAIKGKLLGHQLAVGAKQDRDLKLKKKGFCVN